MTTSANWFPNDPGMQAPETRAQIWRENRAQHTIVEQEGELPVCDKCGRIGAQLSHDPCALPIDIARDPMSWRVAFPWNK